MARICIALALLALLAVSTTTAQPSLEDLAASFPVDALAPGPLPELPTVADVHGKFLAKVSGIRVMVSGVRETVHDKIEEVSEALGVDGVAS